MDYEKKYKEAIERFKAFKEKYYTKNTVIGDAIFDKTGEMQRDFESIFPELRESEDERVRKRAVAILKQQRDYWSYDGPMDKFSPAIPRKDLVDAIDVALSYLEKQKEQKPDIEHIQQSWYMEGYQDREHNLESKWIIKTCKGGPRYEENPKYGQMLAEQKPIPDWMPKFLDELRSKKNYFDWDEHRDIEGCILAIIDWIAPNYFDRKEKEQKELSLMDGNADLYFDEWNQQKQNPTKRQCFEEGMRYAGRLQKEQKPLKVLYLPKFREGDMVVSTRNRHLTYRILNVGSINELGNPEYKVEIFTDGKPGILDKEHYIKSIEIEKMDEWGELIEQKPAEWSEEDKLWLSEVYFAIDHSMYSEVERQAMKKYIDYLRYQSQSKQEWSEEDTKMYINVASSLRGYACGLENEEHKIHIKKELIWLEYRFKSLRPSWKPSEEQMKWLKDVIETVPMTCRQQLPLESLYEDLKKL